MNIKEAKEQIKNAMTAYFTKDEFGGYVIPIEKQRPIFLMGPPGIGKTAVMEQVAAEMGVGLLSYSMTHHTRQSALGLPFIEKKTYDGREYSVSEYTMSEIIASVYDMTEQTGVKEGILFLDEINCVSETLAPVMLQFLQYKIFGRHRVPAGWIVVTAGNPPEFNDSVREFDIVTWDRLKRVDVEPDYDIWKEYAYNVGVHPAVTTYLDIKKGNFYKIETTVDGKSFVTARGWSDLSDMMRLYERYGIPVDEKLVAQYLQNRKVAKDFAVYYDLFNKYRSDYQVESILAGKASAEIKRRAQAAKFDERLSLIGLMLDSVGNGIRETMTAYQVTKRLTAALTEVKGKLAKPAKEPREYMEELIAKEQTALETKKRASSLSRDEEEQSRRLIALLEEEKRLLADVKVEKAFATLKADFDSRVKAYNEKVKRAGEQLENMFGFCEEVFDEGQEMLIVVTELTIKKSAADFISRYGCESYFKHNKNLLIYERHQEITREIESLNLD